MATVTGSQDKVNVTTNQLAERLGVEYPAAQGLIRLLSSRGVVTEAGKQPTKTGKGKAATIYSFPRTFTVNLEESNRPLSTEPPPDIEKSYNVEGGTC